MEPSGERSSSSSPYTRAMQRQDSIDSEEARWTRTRETSGDGLTDAPTPASAAPREPPLYAPIASSSRNTLGGSGSSSGNNTVNVNNSVTPAMQSLNVNEEDEDVHIAVMALGAMKHLDRRAPGSIASSSQATGSGDRFGRQRDDSGASMTGDSSTISTSSVDSTAISSPSSTPVTELTQASFSTGAPSVTSTQFEPQEASSSSSRLPKKPATLADLPPDFEFPAVVRDEDGNEVEVDQEMLRDADFLNRVSHLPLVRGTLRAYEIGKQKSRIVKYGGDLVESSVRAISRPVVGRLGASLGEKGQAQLDEFACRQLDRFYPGSSQATSPEDRQPILDELERREKTEWADLTEEEKDQRRRSYLASKVEEKKRQKSAAGGNELRQRKGKAKGGAMLPPDSKTSSNEAATSAMDKQVAQLRNSHAAGSASPSGSSRGSVTAAEVQSALVEDAKNGGGSRWGSMLIEAGATAGGLSAAMSEESMKSLKYCLQWLQYATAHIDHQITILRDLIVKLNHGELELTSPAAQNLTQIKGDVVNTIRSVVDVVGKYAGGALPEPARVSVKAFILSLPARWASVNRAPAVTNTSSFGGSPASPSFSTLHLSGGGSSPPGASSPTDSGLRSRSNSNAQHMSAAATAQAANRVLTLAVESLDILRSVTVVVGESLERADLWVERLRMLGLQRKRQHEQDDPNLLLEGGTSASGAAAAPHWESARGLTHSNRRSSVGAESDLSMGTSASKRRRLRAEGMPSSVAMTGSSSQQGAEGSSISSGLAGVSSDAWSSSRPQQGSSKGDGSRWHQTSSVRTSSVSIPSIAAIASSPGDGKTTTMTPPGGTASPLSPSSGSSGSLQNRRRPIAGNSRGAAGGGGTTPSYEMKQWP